MNDYFSDREQGHRPRISERISPEAWGGIASTVQSLINTGAFSHKFPRLCHDGHYIIGTDESALSYAVKAEIHELDWPLVTEKTENKLPFTKKIPFAPETLLALDLIEFCYRIVKDPIQIEHHNNCRPYPSHYHLDFEENKGKEKFREDINRIFSRNGLAFELNDEGKIIRLSPTVLREILLNTIFCTGDKKLDEMLEESRRKFFDPSGLVRTEALKELWDCFEGLMDSKKQIISDAAGANHNFKERLDEEKKEIKRIGNNFYIRHANSKQTEITDLAHIDYLYHRLYSFIYLLLPKRDVKNKKAERAP